MAFIRGTSYHFVSHRGNGLCLNVYGNDTIGNNRNVCLWSWSDSLAQNWKIVYDGSDRIVSSINTNYALNVLRTNYNCDVYPYLGNELDARVIMVAVDAANNLYKIKLVRENRYLTAPAVATNNGNVDWQMALVTAEARQIWKLRPSSEPPSPGTPGNSTFTGHFVSFSGTGGSLNVYGSENISPNRNICVWSWDDTMSQTFSVAIYNNYQKIFSRLEYPKYALNYYRNTARNCDVYPHVGNDLDSAVVPYNVSGNIFYFKLRNYDLYLTAAGKGNGANVYWAPRVNGDSQHWMLTTTRPSSHGLNLAMMREAISAYCEPMRDRYPGGLQLPYIQAGVGKWSHSVIQLNLQELIPDGASQEEAQAIVTGTPRKTGMDCSGMVFNVLDYATGGALCEYFNTTANYVSADTLTSTINATILTSVGQIRPGDVIRVQGGQHVMIVDSIQGNVIHYAHSSASSGTKGPHRGQILIGNWDEDITGSSHTWSDEGYENVDSLIGLVNYAMRPKYTE